MRIIVFSICFNQARILPFYLRHYSSFADEISVFDDHSTDGSRELLQANPKVLLRDWPYDTGIDEDLFLQHAYDWNIKAFQGKFDWVIWSDCDEFIYAPDVRAVLENADGDVIQTKGYNMLGDGLPKDDGKSQIWQLHKNGVSAPVYSKPVVFRAWVKIGWNRGKHALENCEPKLTSKPMLKLLHYRYMGYEYTKEINAKNYSRCGLKSGDKGAAWSCAPDYKGEHSAAWAAKMKHKALNVVDAPM